MSGGKSGRALIIGAALLWGLAGVCVKSVSWGSMTLIVARSILSLVVLLLFRGKKKIHITKVNLIGALMPTATGMLYLVSLKMTTAGTAIVLQYIAPILVFLYAVIFQHRKVKPAEVLITLVVFGGIVLSFADRMDPGAVLGNLLALASGFTFAAQIIYMNREDANAEDAMLISCVFSMVAAFPFMLGEGMPVLDFTNIFWVLMLGLFQYGLANVLFTKGIRRIDKVEASLLLTIEPIFNPIPVAVFCGERMGTLALIGSAVVIVFVTLHGLLPNLEEKRRARKGGDISS